MKTSCSVWNRRYIEQRKNKVAKGAILCQIRICIANKNDEAFNLAASERLKDSEVKH